MKEKAFTLIELLAVIVILAIIALIATPIILGIINDARENSKKRSAELVYTGVEYAYTNALFKEGNGNVVDSVDLDTIDKYLNVENVVRHEVNGTTLEIVTKDNVYCGVTKNETTKTFDVVCGTDPEDYTATDVMAVKSIAYDVAPVKSGPKYYGFVSSGSIGDNLEDLGVDTNPPSGRNSYLGFDSEDGITVSAAYVCFIVEDTPYCLKALKDATDESAYNANQDVMRKAFPDCSGISDDYSDCELGGISAHTERYGFEDGIYRVTANVDGTSCDAYFDIGLFECSEPCSDC